jgi:hypothetical protein
MAQDAQSLISKVEDNFKTKHPDWRFLYKQIDATNTVYVYYIEKIALQFLIGYTDSEEMATKEYENYKHGMPVGPKAQLKDLGDEAVLYQSNGREKCSIYFRKSNVVVVMIGAPSFTVAEGLAKEIAGLIPNK